MHDRFDSEVILYDQAQVNSKSTTPVTKQMMAIGKIQHGDTIQKFEHTGMIRGSLDASAGPAPRDRSSNQAMHRRSSGFSQVVQTDQSYDLNNLNRRESN